MSKRGSNRHRITICYRLEEFITQEIGLIKVPNISESRKHPKLNCQSLTSQQNYISSLTNYKNPGKFVYHDLIVTK